MRARSPIASDSPKAGRRDDASRLLRDPRDRLRESRGARRTRSPTIDCRPEDAQASSVFATSPTRPVPLALASSIAPRRIPSEVRASRAALLNRVSSLPLGDQPGRPGRHRVTWRHAPAHPRKLEVRMRIDQGGQNGDSRLAFGLAFGVRGSRVSRGADGDDATVVDLDPSIANWRRVDGQDPGGAVDAGHGLNRRI